MNFVDSDLFGSDSDTYMGYTGGVQFNLVDNAGIYAEHTVVEGEGVTTAGLRFKF